MQFSSLFRRKTVAVVPESQKSVVRQAAVPRKDPKKIVISKTLSKKTNALGNRFVEHRELLEDYQKFVAGLPDTVNEQVRKTSEQLDAFSEEVDKAAAELDSITVRIHSITACLDNMERRVDHVDDRPDAMNEQVRDLAPRLDKITRQGDGEVKLANNNAGLLENTTRAVRPVDAAAILKQGKANQDAGARSPPEPAMT
ncbi:hypothetical protein GE09DRAFT_1127214 [Coniochaeta sp. 2T2.1]|nr:hypothetical protein GE09DRAFT_1127214 [Coniochaeta sp. 2T2.1]